jgi:hypothetical protein
MGLFKNELRTQKEKKICDKIVKYTNIMEYQTSYKGQVYQKTKQRSKELFDQLKRICGTDQNRLDENIFYIKKHIKPINKERKVKAGAKIGGVGFDVEVDDRPIK